MAKIALFAVALIGAMAAAATARAEGSWYVSGSVGGYFRGTLDGTTPITNHVITAPGNLTTSYDPGIIANLAVGYRLPRHFRLELEAGYVNYQPSKVNPFSTPFPTLRGQDFDRQSGGDNTVYMATSNLFFDFPPLLAGLIAPYIGAGIGGAHTEVTRALFVDASGNRFGSPGGQATHGVALLEGGITIPLGEGIALVPAYRYIHFFANPSPRGDEVAHIAKLGLRYSF